MTQNPGAGREPTTGATTTKPPPSIPEDVFRCDYCGQLADVDDGMTFWRHVETLDSAQRLYLPAVYCSAYCGRTATTGHGSGRG